MRTRVYLTPEADWRGALRAHKELFGGIDPANTTVIVVGFPAPGMLVEVEVDAELSQWEESAGYGQRDVDVLLDRYWRAWFAHDVDATWRSSATTACYALTRGERVQGAEVVSGPRSGDA